MRNSEVKEKIQVLAPDEAHNIIVLDEDSQNDNLTKEKTAAIVQAQQCDDARYVEITELYKSDEKEAKKKISKMLSKDKEKYILYLLKSR